MADPASAAGLSVAESLDALIASFFASHNPITYLLLGIITVTLVYPRDADISRGRVSVLTPVGAALIGVSAGDSITWETRTGELRKLTVLKIRTRETD